MRIGLLSDTHDNVRNARTAAEIFRLQGVTRLFHCGDVCGPTIVQLFDAFDVTFAEGNMDRVSTLGLAVEALQRPGRLARLHRLTLDGRSAVLLHGDDGALRRRLIASEEIAYVFHGHTHRRVDRRVGPTRVINPGALGGVRYEARSICILNVETGKAEFILVQERRSEGE
jgi:putative phosphoesterase